ncbi:SEC-C domain-containing protein [Asanoa iriomotensis]|uniref:Preprotein translocase SecA n=1 Tax=Asanoa iriomotensis TaxID=234613 RepID=A0ABQ4C6U2_9ACTN|nr:SEC-C domain-containing protein [Asanoa iriomotensis]GIF58502.1 preprotein translocase SecA [Asanoa iriomotensis]
MTIASTLSVDELDAIAEGAAERGEPAAGAAELVAIVDGGRLADPRDDVVALGMAAELLFNADDPAGSLDLTDRAIDAHRRHGTAADFAQLFRARLLFELDRADEAMAELTPLRPLLTTDPDAAAEIAEALLAGGRGETAHEWLSVAVDEARAALPETDDLDDAGELATVIVYALITQRHAVRHELGLPHDALDEMAEELEAAAEEEHQAELTAALSGPFLFLPAAEFARLAERRPDLAESCGPTWEAHRADIEHILATVAETGITGARGIVRGTADELVQLSERRGDDPVDDVLDDYADELDGRGLNVPWPPARNDVCWCGSEVKYKKCCLPRSR